MLYHVSEAPNITRFEPRAGATVSEPVVWAVDEHKLRNYLLPRDCPRVTFFARDTSTPDDVARFLGSGPAVVAFELAWLDRVRSARLYVYALPADMFTCVDVCAGYFHSRVAGEPAGVSVVDDCLGALVSRGVEVRIVPSLWSLHDAVAASSLGFSIIRMRNTQPR